MLDPLEERITRKIFEPLAGRKFTEKEVEEIIDDIKVTGEIIRSNPDLMDAIGMKPGENNRSMLLTVETEKGRIINY